MFSFFVFIYFNLLECGWLVYVNNLGFIIINNGLIGKICVYFICLNYEKEYMCVIDFK